MLDSVSYRAGGGVRLYSPQFTMNQDKRPQPPLPMSESPKINGHALGWSVAAWLSALAWLFHSFAVRQFVESVHSIGGALGKR